MRKAVMYGAGNIGRGFIGALLSQSGYAVTFIDIVEDTVSRLHLEHCYSLRIVSSDGYEDTMIENVDAIHGNNCAAVTQAIAEADIMATAVGVNVLKFIIPNITAGLRRRFQTTQEPLNIIICENLMDADKMMGRMIKEHLTAGESAQFDRQVGLVEASIGRMVPVQTPEMRDGNPLRVCVEAYGYLPVDKESFKGEIPAIKNLVPYSPFGFYLRRKLYVHNMGHAICAYLGMYIGESFIYEAVDNPDILLIAKNAMLESLEALNAEYGSPAIDILHHIDDLLLRFTNRALGDTCARVGGDTTRKLSASDRLIGAAKLCLAHNVLPVHIAVGAAAAVHQHLLERELPQTEANANLILLEISELTGEDGLLNLILSMYQWLRQGTTPGQLRKAAQQMCARHSTI